MEPALTRPLGRHPDFIKLWAGETISQFGTQISILAIPLAAVQILGASPFQMGALSALETAAFLLIALPAGVLVDRGRRRRFLIAGNLGRGIALSTIPIAFLIDGLTIYQLYGVALVVGVCTVFFDASYQAYLPSLVDRTQLVEGNSKLEVSRSAAAISGPGFGGVLVQWVRAPMAVAFDALSFFVSAAFIALIRKSEPKPAAVAARNMKTEIGEGLKVIFGNPILRGIAGSTGTSNLFSSMSIPVFILFAVEQMDLSAAQLGLVFSIGNIGFLAGAVLAGRISRRLGLGSSVIGSMFLGGLSGFFLPLADKATALLLFSLSFALLSMTGAVYNIGQVSYRQAITPEQLQGRMNATMRFVIWGTMPIGSLIGGTLGETIGLKPTLWVAAVGGALAFLWILFSPLRGVRAMPDPVG